MPVKEILGQCAKDLGRAKRLLSGLSSAAPANVNKSKATSATIAIRFLIGH